MSQTKNSRDATQEVLTALEQLQVSSGFGSIDMALHEVTKIERREKYVL